MLHRPLVFQAPPQIPRGDGTIRMPDGSDAVHFGGLGELIQRIGFLHGGAHAEIADGKDVGPPQCEHQEHLHGPDADALHAGERGDHSVVVHFGKVFELNVRHKTKFLLIKPWWRGLLESSPLAELGAYGS